MLRTKSGGSLQSVLLMQLERGISRAEHEMVSSGQELLILSNPEVPVDTGALASSGGVEGPIREGDKSSVEVFYGDDNVFNPEHGKATSTYAQDQHENLSYRHINGGKAHFLTNPLDVMRDGIVQRISRAFVKGLTS